MSLDKTTVARIATLARIRVPDERLEPLGRALDTILDWVRMLDEVDTTGVPPMAGGADTGLPLRDDRVTDGARAAQILANAPAAAHGFFTVPKVVE